MNNIRPATKDDIGRIAEIEVFNYRLNFYPIFLSDYFYFKEVTVEKRAEHYREELTEGAISIYVYDDGVVKGFFHMVGCEVRKLFVEPVLQGGGIGAELLEYAVREKGAKELWALEKNEKAIRFYKRHDFCPTGERKPESGTSEYLVKLAR
ncbi:MAG: GNAT family N-acetyltransferase [Clostridia bacterium]|nr:GNAT family N-acetyltransferase [Clostridia bacterium]MBQ2326517.1 GNAT family N-acetyltransferase [Clostridia bacterium]